ncbi:MAG TPA: ATP-binding protein [Candidatus Limnocylindrales bacterium]|nr:ATP-binding protein [Candidatus Limnocylindrales bacterium]
MRLAVEQRGVRWSWSALDLAIAGFSLTAVATTVLSLGQPAITPIGPIPILLALGAFCVAALARRPAPSLAWIATIGGSFAASSIPIDQARAADPGQLGVGPWLGLAVPASVGAIVTLGIAARYATRADRRLGRIAVPVSVGLFAWLVVACATTIGLIGTGQARADPEFTWIDVATAPIAGFVRFVVVVTTLGVLADVRAGYERARERLAGPPTTTAAAERAWALAVATIRELVPGQSAAEEASLAAERTRLAGDLHATVLPGLRRAIAEAESGGDPDVLARQLRTVDLELERLMADRWPVVLEAFGLVAALEDLAERIEADTSLGVQIDVERAGDRPPPTIERAAWRVAQLAVDNAARHAEASLVTVTVSVDVERLVLAIADDGRGFDPDTAGAVRAGARGLADATRRAAAVGAAIRIEPRPGGGTTVTFDWTAHRA